MYVCVCEFRNKRNLWEKLIEPSTRAMALPVHGVSNLAISYKFQYINWHDLMESSCRFNVEC